MNESESDLKKFAESQGYTVIRNGWPDFAVMRADGSLFCIEVKSRYGTLSQEQEDIMEFLSLAGIPCYISRNGRFPDLSDPKAKFEIVVPVRDAHLACRLCELNAEDYHASVDSKYHYRLELIEEKLIQIRKLCED